MPRSILPTKRRQRCRTKSIVTIVFIFVVITGLCRVSMAGNKDLHQIQQWSEGDKEVLRSLSLSSLPPLPSEPSNAYADNPKAIAMGKNLFFDKRFSANGKVSCATCHMPEYSFTDRLPLAMGMGTLTRRTMPLIGAAYQRWYFWDGRKDSLWSQAIGPIESPPEHGITRSYCAHLIIEKYKKEYSEIFGSLPKLNHKSCPPNASPGTDNPAALKLWNAMKPRDRDAVNRVYANIGKSIDAFVRRILPSPAPFDLYVDAVLRNDQAVADKAMGRDAVEGLRLFIGKAKCISCHAGALFTDTGFHNIGIDSPKDNGRADGIDKVLSDEFNCLGKYSDAKPRECRILRSIDKDKSKYTVAFKTPTLRNVADRPPYMNAGQFNSLEEVLFFYRKSPSREVEHRDLTDEELLKIEAFLKTLSGPLNFP